MVNVIHATGIAAAMTTAIDLSPYLADDIARLIGTRHEAVAHTHNFTGSAIAAHSHSVATTLRAAPTTPAGSIDEQDATIANRVVAENGLLNTAYTAPGAGSVALTGRKQVHMGNAIESTDILELRILYMKEAAGVF